MSKDWSNPPEWFTEKRYAYLRKLPLASWQYELQRCAWLRDSAEPGQWNERPAVPSFIGPPIVQFIKKGPTTLHQIEKPALIVQLNAPDGVIVEQFKKALALARMRYPEPIKKPGPKSANAAFSQKQVSTWLNYKIVQLCELDNWREGLRKDSRPKNSDFGCWLFFKRAQPSKEIVTARKVLDRAIACIPALWAQTEGRTLEFVTSN
jgi:hypothetical protein